MPWGPVAPVAPVGPAGPGTVLSAPAGPAGPVAPAGPAGPGGPGGPGSPLQASPTGSHGTSGGWGWPSNPGPPGTLISPSNDGPGTHGTGSGCGEPINPGPPGMVTPSGIARLLAYAVGGRIGCQVRPLRAARHALLLDGQTMSGWSNPMRRRRFIQNAPTPVPTAAPQASRSGGVSGSCCAAIHDETICCECSKQRGQRGIACA